MKILFNYCFIIAFLCTSQLAFSAELIDLNSKEVSKRQKNALIIDIRTPQEWENTGLIPDSHPLQFFDRNGKYDLDAWLAAVKKLQSSPDQALVLVCRSGYRSGRVGNLLVQQLNYADVSHLSNGIYAWIKEKRPTVNVSTATQSC